MMHSLRSLAVSTLAVPVLAVAAVVATATTPALAQEQTLKVGSSAPELTVGGWVQGEVTSMTDPAKTYIVEFWATWCGPCMRSIPHLNALYNRNKGAGLVIIGISDEPMSTVRPFVAKKGASMSYPVAIDTSEKAAGSAWMKAANQNGIPCAFVVRGGKVMWIGNPLDDTFDLVVSAVMRGRYDPELTRKASPLLAAARESLKVKNFRDAYRHYDAMIALDQRVFGEVASTKYESMLADAKDPAAARAWGDTVLTKWADDKYALVDLAQTILGSDRIQNRDFELAGRAVEQLAKLVPSSDSIALNLRARVSFAQGKFDEASEIQYQAWLAASPDEKADQKTLLDEYRKTAKSKGSKASAKVTAPAQPEEGKKD
jgi:thiol-disulfide isomerase/thioredoxin